MVGDRGMLTQARIGKALCPAGLDWITALRAPAIQALAAETGPLQTLLFDDRDTAEITSPAYPGERLVVCKNPLLAATEADLRKLQARVERARAPLRGAGAIGKALGAIPNRHKVGKHFTTKIADDAFSFARDTAAIEAEAALDGIYVVRTNLPAEHTDAAGAVRAYKSLARVERAFRSLKSGDLELRPVFHWTAPRVRAHVLLCMLAYHLEWQMRQCLAPLLFDDHDTATRDAQRTSPVAKAVASPAAPRLPPAPRPPATAPMPPLATFCRCIAFAPCSLTWQR